MAIVYGTNNSETINASDGVTELADTIYGYGGNDTILGLGGNDLIIGGAGGDAIDGGDDIDTAFYTNFDRGRDRQPGDRHGRRRHRARATR